jgi:5-methylcytosine-specific restriction endonuclease McrA
MPRTDREAYNAYMNEYLTRRYHRRRTAALEQLGGRCVDCGSTDSLEFDHVDPEMKSFNIGALFATGSNERLKTELAKCVLRCSSCHMTKTLADRGQQSARETHGTLSSYRYCRCDVCKAAKSASNRAYKAARKERSK